MTLRLVYIVQAVLGLLFGLAFLFIPVTLLDAYAVTLPEGAAIVGSFLGGAYISIAAVSWFIKDDAESPTGMKVTTAFVLGNLVGLLVSLYGQLATDVNALGWSTVAIFLLLTLAFGYYRFMSPA